MVELSVPDEDVSVDDVPESVFVFELVSVFEELSPVELLPLSVDELVSVVAVLSTTGGGFSIGHTVLSYLIVPICSIVVSSHP